jgi:thiol-disulfide isomerase/thioredoxin
MRVVVLASLVACSAPARRDPEPHVMKRQAAAARWEGLDVAPAGPDGAAVDLVPVPGKITIFDFWATWCQPCEKLDAALADLSRRNPGRLAVRKLNVIDWDSPAAERWLTPRNFNLPHVEVFGPDGALLLSKSGSPPVLVRAIEELLAPPGPDEPPPPDPE